MGIVIVDEHYGQKYTDETLKSLKEDNGKLWVVTQGDDGQIVAFGAGIAPASDNPFHVMGHIVKKEGIVTELFVLEEYRGKGIARRLVEVIEGFFVEQGCNYSRIAVMADNGGAHAAYLKMGYQDRTVEMLRKIGK